MLIILYDQIDLVDTNILDFFYKDDSVFEALILFLKPGNMQQCMPVVQHQQARHAGETNLP